MHERLCISWNRLSFFYRAYVRGVHLNRQTSTGLSPRLWAIEYCKYLFLGSYHLFWIFMVNLLLIFLRLQTRHDRCSGYGIHRCVGFNSKDSTRPQWNLHWPPLTILIYEATFWAQSESKKYKDSHIEVGAERHRNILRIFRFAAILTMDCQSHIYCFVDSL